MQRIQIAGITKCSCVDGEGVRMVLFVQGCAKKCPGCHNPNTWDPRGGKEFKIQSILNKIDSIPERYSGITISGGEPFLQERACCVIAQHAHYSGLSVWVYTGYIYEDLLRENRPLLKYIDVLVDGPFIEALKCTDLPFRGSSNQRIINISKGEINKWKIKG